jgi:hypothetical protein
MPRLETTLTTWVGVAGAGAGCGGEGGGAAAAATAALPLPPTVYAGEVLRATLTVKNVGSCPARNVAVAYESALAEEVDEDDGGRRASLAGGAGGGAGGGNGTAPPPLALALARRPESMAKVADPGGASDALAALRLAEDAAGEEPVPDPLAAAATAAAERGNGGAPAALPRPPPPLSQDDAAALLSRVSGQTGNNSSAPVLPRTAALAGLLPAPSQPPPPLPLLRPSESACATLWILASRSGAASVRVAWYCEPDPPPAAAGELSCRLSRAAWPLTALPLLRSGSGGGAQSRLAGGGGGGGAIDVLLDVEAARVGARPFVTGLGVLPPLTVGSCSPQRQRQWAIAAAGAAAGGALPLLPLALPLEPGQQAAVAGRLVPLTGAASGATTTSSPLDSRVLSELLCAQRLQGQRWLRGQGGAGSSAPPTAVDLALCWRLPAGDDDDEHGTIGPASLAPPPRAGLLLLPDALAPLRERPIQLSVAVAASAAASASASAAATVITTIPHDFASSPLCVVPLTLRVANSGDRACAVEVLLGDAGDASAAASAARAAAASAWHVGGGGGPSPSSSQAGLPPGPEMAWVGASRVAVGGEVAGAATATVALAPGAVAEVPLAVAAMRAGHHSLPDYRVEWRPVGGVEEAEGEEEGKTEGGGVIVGPALSLVVGGAGPPR